MIEKVTLRRFKRFSEVEIPLGGPVVLAGPNNSGKTTVLQAIAAWSVAFQVWREKERFQLFRGVHTKAQITRDRFSAAVPLRKFDLLWKDLKIKDRIEIELTSSDGWSITMELERQSAEQINARPKPGLAPETLKDAGVKVVYVPPITGVSTQEPVYKTPKINQLLGLGKPGDVLRNLLVEAWEDYESAWVPLTGAIRDLFGYELAKPDAAGADILAEYQTREHGPRFDIASAGSGFQQVLMLLTFLHTRPASVLLVDEPDAHLHMVLQEVIYDRLLRLAAERKSQIILATHSQVIINTVSPSALCILHEGGARRLQTKAERTRLMEALRVVTQVDLMLAQTAPGVLYLEGHTDLSMLREWARILKHPAYETLTKRCFWKPLGSAPDEARKHHEALTIYRPDLPGLILVDGDNKRAADGGTITGKGYQRLRWTRYDIENYLVHPRTIDHFIAQEFGEGEASALQRKAALDWFQSTWRTIESVDFMGGFRGVEATLQQDKTRKDILPKILTAAEIHGMDYTEYHRIAAVMLPEEIHPEVTEKLDAIQKAFGLP